MEMHYDFCARFASRRLFSASILDFIIVTFMSAEK